MQKMFVRNAQQAAPFYEKMGVMWPSRFIGMEMFGNLLPSKVRKVLNAAEDAVVELMCHPGWSATGDSPWNSSPDRTTEKQQLEAPEFTLLAE